MNQTKKKNPLKRLLSMRGMGQVVTVTIGLIVLLVAFALINPNFWSPTNRTNLLRQIAPILIIGIAQSYPDGFRREGHVPSGKQHQAQRGCDHSAQNV